MKGNFKIYTYLNPPSTGINKGLKYR